MHRGLMTSLATSTDGWTSSNGAFRYFVLLLYLGLGFIWPYILNIMIGVAAQKEPN